MDEASATACTEFLNCSSALRCTYERLAIEETDFFEVNRLDLQLWNDCYAKVVKELSSSITQKTQRATIHQISVLRNFLIFILDEGISFYQLLLRFEGFSPEIRYSMMLCAARLLRRRERASSSVAALGVDRSFFLAQDAITLEPHKGPGYLLLSEWADEDGDSTLSLFWALTAASVNDPSLDGCKHQLSQLSRQRLICEPGANGKSSVTSSNTASASYASIITQLLQVSGHALLNQLTSSTSHYKHLDLLTHTKLFFAKESAPPSSTEASIGLKYLITSLWLLVGHREFFTQRDGNISPIQSCILAKIFQFHRHFLSNPVLFNVLWAFGTNPHYATLFCGRNHETLGKTFPFALHCLDDLLEDLISFNLSNHSTKQTTRESQGLEFLIFETFNSLPQPPENEGKPQSEQLIDFFVKAGILVQDLEHLDVEEGDEIIKIGAGNNQIKTKIDYSRVYTPQGLARAQKIKTSKKLLTRQLLKSQVKALENITEPPDAPLILPDFTTLIQEFNQFKTLILARKARFYLTAVILEELDAWKSIKSAKDGDVYKIIRFLDDRVQLGDPCIKLQSPADLPPANEQIPVADFKRIEQFELAHLTMDNENSASMPLKTVLRFRCEHLRNVRHVLPKFSGCRVICANLGLFGCLLQDQADLHLTLSDNEFT